MAKIWIEVKIRCNLVLELIDAKLSRKEKIRDKDENERPKSEARPDIDVAS